MLANSLADIVAEEAAKRLLLDMNLERAAKKSERIGVSVAKRLALVLKEEEACTRSAIGRLVDELAHQGHLLARQNKGLKCKACNVYRADRQFNLWSRTPCVPRSCAADIVSRFRNRKRKHISAFTDNSVNGFSTVSSRVTSTSTRQYESSGLDPDHPDSLDVRFTEDPSLTVLFSAEHAETIFGNLLARYLLCFLSRTM